MAQASGLPILHFIAACNANSAVSEYLQTGKYAGKPVIPTMSNAMDVGNPSNFVRILEIFDQQYNNVKNELTAFNISDELTRQVIGEVFEKENYLLDPHGAVAYISLKEYLSNHPTQLGYFLETAHPVKFYDVVEPVINSKIEIPDAVKKLFSKKKTSVKMKPEYALLKEFLYK
jgi:threonine synthase